MVDSVYVRLCLKLLGPSRLWFAFVSKSLAVSNETEISIVELAKLEEFRNLFCSSRLCC